MDPFTVLDTTLQPLGEVAPHVEGCTIVEHNSHVPTGEGGESAIIRDGTLLQYTGGERIYHQGLLLKTKNSKIFNFIHLFQPRIYDQEHFVIISDKDKLSITDKKSLTLLFQNLYSLIKRAFTSFYNACGLIFKIKLFFCATKIIIQSIYPTVSLHIHVFLLYLPATDICLCQNFVLLICLIIEPGKKS